MSYNDNLYTKNYNTFNEWMNHVISKKTVYPRFRIPYDEWVRDYIEDIKNKSIDDVKSLIRYLLMPINRKMDLMDYESFKRMQNSDNESFRMLYIKMSQNERYIRIENGQDAWEGLTWVLELLPSRPYRAIQALKSYVLAQHNLTDDRITGIDQCADIIMAKFIYYENPLEKLLQLKPIEFEWLIEELYLLMGYNTVWTPSTRDGGKDIIATIMRMDGYERIYVECKLYSTTDLTLETVKAFFGTIIKDEISRGVLFCTGYVNENLKEFDKRIQIWAYEDINVLLNAHLGSDWAERLDIVISNQRKKYKKTNN